MTRPRTVWRLGFTGTREGMTPLQRQHLLRKLSEDAKPGAEFHHGDCLGADEEADAIARTAGWTRVAHPPAHGTYRAHCRADVILERKPYLERDRDIVDATTHLLAAPKEAIEPASGRGGTWYTIHYALRSGKPVAILWPGGTVEVRQPAERPIPSGMDWHPRQIGRKGAGG